MGCGVGRGIVFEFLRKRVGGLGRGFERKEGLFWGYGVGQR